MKRTTTPKKPAPHRTTTQTILDVTGPAFPRGDLTGTAGESFREVVLAFYKNHGRHDMPWRHTDDPYRILVSEIMLQQTQVERVTVKYPEFIAAFPDFAALAQAPLHDVLAAWQGMGYNRRAIALKKCAEIITREHSGVLPRDPEILVTLPGIGPATASSICAFAFDLPVVFIETNIRRVFIHFFFSGAEIVTDKEILPLVEKTLDQKSPRIWYWALMDFGTELKKSVPNPNRRSAGYTKQAPFEGSDRRIRGMILKFLIGKSSCGEDEILECVREEPARVHRILAALEKEGFVRTNQGRYHLAE